MHPANPPGVARGARELGYGDGGGVGEEQRARGEDPVERGERLFFRPDLLDDGFYGGVGFAELFAVRRPADAVVVGRGLVFGEGPFARKTREAFADVDLGAFERFHGGVAGHDGVA